MARWKRTVSNIPVAFNNVLLHKPRNHSLFMTLTQDLVLCVRGGGLPPPPHPLHLVSQGPPAVWVTSVYDVLTIFKHKSHFEYFLYSNPLGGRDGLIFSNALFRALP